MTSQPNFTITHYVPANNWACAYSANRDRFYNVEFFMWEGHLEVRDITTCGKHKRTVLGNKIGQEILTEINRLLKEDPKGGWFIYDVDGVTEKRPFVG